MITHPKRTYATFSASDVTRIAQVPQATQRDLRRRNYLPPTGNGRARFTVLQLGQIIVMKELMDRGIGPAIAQEIARKAEKSVVWFALAENDDAVKLCGSESEKAAFLTERDRVRMLEGFGDVDYLAGLTDQERVRFCVLFTDNEPTWRNDTAGLFDAAPGKSVLVIDLLSMGLLLAQEAHKPLLTIDLTKDETAEPVAKKEVVVGGGSSQDADADGPAPRGLSREAAASYLGVDPRTFERMVGEGVMPPPRKLGTHLLWDRAAIDSAFNEIAAQPIRKESPDEA